MNEIASNAGWMLDLMIGWNWNIISQVIIVVLGGFAVLMSQSYQYERRKWACIIGMIGQPFWFYTSYINKQWGIFAISFFYLFAWARGIKTYWRK